MTLLTDERKEELAADLEYAINRYLDKQWIISNKIDCLVETEEERNYLNHINWSFVVDRD